MTPVLTADLMLPAVTPRFSVRWKTTKKRMHGIIPSMDAARCSVITTPCSLLASAIAKGTVCSVIRYQEDERQKELVKGPDEEEDVKDGQGRQRDWTTTRQSILKCPAPSIIAASINSRNALKTEVNKYVPNAELRGRMRITANLCHTCPLT